MGEHKDNLKAVHAGTAALRQEIPEVYAGFGNLYKAVYVDGALPAKVKELMAVTIAIYSGCDGCIASHVRSAVRKGVTPAEMAEAIGVALQMGGGPASTYAPRAWAAYGEFSEATGPQTMS